MLRLRTTAAAHAAAILIVILIIDNRRYFITRMRRYDFIAIKKTDSVTYRIIIAAACYQG